MDKTYEKSLDFVEREIAGEFILIPLRRQLTDVNSLYLLNEWGASAWRTLDGTRSVQDIANDLLNEYDVSREQLEEDLHLLIQDLLSIQAIHEVS